MAEKKKILVVDDSALMRRVVCDIINSDENLVVADIAKDGVEAFALLTDNQYDVVVLDINMPRMSGLELLEKLLWCFFFLSQTYVSYITLLISLLPLFSVRHSFYV